MLSLCIRFMSCRTKCGILCFLGVLFVLNIHYFLVFSNSYFAREQNPWESDFELSDLDGKSAFILIFNIC